MAFPTGPRRVRAGERSGSGLSTSASWSTTSSAEWPSAIRRSRSSRPVPLSRTERQFFCSLCTPRRSVRSLGAGRCAWSWRIPSQCNRPDHWIKKKSGANGQPSAVRRLPTDQARISDLLLAIYFAGDPVTPPEPGIAEGRSAACRLQFAFQPAGGPALRGASESCRRSGLQGMRWSPCRGSLPARRRCIPRDRRRGLHVSDLGSPSRSRSTASGSWQRRRRSPTCRPARPTASRTRASSRRRC